MNRGKYIVLEGPEGVGKTTQIQELARRLQVAGLPVRMLREPDSQSDLTARALRHLTQDPRYPMNTNTEVLLYNAARSQSLQVIKESVEQGIVCIVDRNYLTTLAIQYYGRGDVPDYETINRIIDFAVNGVEPDLCVVLDAPVQTLRERAKSRDQGERFDNLDDAFLERVRAGYLWEAKQRDLPVIFATDDTTTVADNIWKLVAETLTIRTPSNAAAASQEPASVKQILDQKKADTAATEPLSSPGLDSAIAANADRQMEAASSTTPNASNIPMILQQLDKQTTPDFLVPTSLDKKTALLYKQAISGILKTRAEIMKRLKVSDPEARAAIRLSLPLACYLNSDSSAIDLLSPRDNPALAEIATARLKATYDDSGDPVELTNYWPRNELSLVPQLLYGYTAMSFKQLSDQVDTWSYDQKSAALSASLTNSPGVGLTNVGYSWNLMTNFDILLSISGQQFVDIVTQQLTPRYGYDVPEPVEEAGLSDLFEACFDSSLKLYSQLQAAGYDTEAQYATLLGHKLRVQVSMSAPAIIGLQSATTKQTPNPLIDAMFKASAAVHPILGATLVARDAQPK